MHKLLSVTLLILFILMGCSNNNTREKFEKEIKNYPYSEEYEDEYYSVYLKEQNIIKALNSINHPDFYSFDNVLPMIKNPVILVNPKFFISHDLKINLVEVTKIDFIKRDNGMYLDKECYDSLINMNEAATSLGLTLTVFSGYRSTIDQTILYENADDKSFVAKPNHSEHELGQAVDIATRSTGLSSHFIKTKEFDFLKKNAHLFGFILRYPKNKESITGYSYEPWHYRYVGEDIAKLIYELDLCLEEYFYNYVYLE